MKNAAFALSTLLALLQGSTTARMTDRELDGIKGPAKRVFEESSRIADGSGAMSARCRNETRIYDPQGRLTSRSVYPGFHCEEEIKDTYTYDPDGNRHEIHDASQASGVRLGPAPAAAATDAVQRRTFRSDQEGRMVVSDSTYNSGGALVYLSVHLYDSQSRTLESQSYDADKKMTGKRTFTYSERDRFPTSSTSFGSDGKPYSKAIYTDYELNSRGDWVRRQEISERPDGSKSTRISYRTIDYY